MAPECDLITTDWLSEEQQEHTRLDRETERSSILTGQGFISVSLAVWDVLKRWSCILQPDTV